MAVWIPYPVNTHIVGTLLNILLILLYTKAISGDDQSPSHFSHSVYAFHIGR